jgi:adenylate kinase
MFRREIKLPCAAINSISPVPFHVTNAWAKMAHLTGGILKTRILQQCLEELCAKKINTSRLLRALDVAGLKSAENIHLDDFMRLLRANNYHTVKELLVDLTYLTPSKELEDATSLFNKAISNILKHDLGDDQKKLVFPKEIIFLCGAPGAGKAECGRAVMSARGIDVNPVVISDLLSSPEAEKKKRGGELFSDGAVLELLLRHLLNHEYKNGVIIDGFPRTKVQTQCVPLLFNLMMTLRSNFMSDKTVSFRRPVFHFVVLFVTEAVSLQRQCMRGIKDEDKKRTHIEWFYDKEVLIRSTDISSDLAQKRYRIFKNETFPALMQLRETMPFHLIDANGPIKQVIANIMRELQYQSELELGHNIFEMIDEIPLASEVVRDSYQRLVVRLEQYNRDHKEIFQEAIRFVHDRFLPIIRAQGLSGKAIIRSDHPVLMTALAKRIIVDVLAERGYAISIDSEKVHHPVGLDMTNQNDSNVLPVIYPDDAFVCHITIDFPLPLIRL